MSFKNNCIVNDKESRKSSSQIESPHQSVIHIVLCIGMSYHCRLGDLLGSENN